MYSLHSIYMLSASINTKLNYYLGHEIDKNSTSFLLGYERLINMLPTWRKISFLVEQNFAGRLSIKMPFFFCFFFSENCRKQYQKGCKKPY